MTRIRSSGSNPLPHPRYPRYPRSIFPIKALDSDQRQGNDGHPNTNDIQPPRLTPTLHEVITKDIIGAAMAVLNELRPGLDEKLYERALVIELRARGHTVDQQREYPVHYRGQCIGKLVPDLIVDHQVITAAKVANGFNDSHVAQMLGYLNITGLQVALLLNFKDVKLDWKRVVNERRRGTADKTIDVNLK